MRASSSACRLPCVTWRVRRSYGAVGVGYKEGEAVPGAAACAALGSGLCFPHPWAFAGRERAAGWDGNAAEMIYRGRGHRGRVPAGPALHRRPACSTALCAASSPSPGAPKLLLQATCCRGDSRLHGSRACQGRAGSLSCAWAARLLKVKVVMVHPSPRACCSAAALLHLLGRVKWEPGGKSSCYCEGIAAIILVFFHFETFFSRSAAAQPHRCASTRSGRLPGAALALTPTQALRCLVHGCGSLFLLTGGNSNPTCSAGHIGGAEGLFCDSWSCSGMLLEAASAHSLTCCG